MFKCRKSKNNADNKNNSNSELKIDSENIEKEDAPKHLQTETTEKKVTDPTTSQKIIIPKGTINPRDTTVIEIPPDLRAKSVVIVTSKNEEFSQIQQPEMVYQNVEGKNPSNRRCKAVCAPCTGNNSRQQQQQQQQQHHQPENGGQSDNCRRHSDNFTKQSSPQVDNRHMRQVGEISGTNYPPRQQPEKSETVYTRQQSEPYYPPRQHSENTETIYPRQQSETNQPPVQQAEQAETIFMRQHIEPNYSHSQQSPKSSSKSSRQTVENTEIIYPDEQSEINYARQRFHNPEPNYTNGQQATKSASKSSKQTVEKPDMISSTQRTEKSDANYSRQQVETNFRGKPERNIKYSERKFEENSNIASTAQHFVREDSAYDEAELRRLENEENEKLQAIQMERRRFFVESKMHIQDKNQTCSLDTKPRTNGCISDKRTYAITDNSENDTVDSRDLRKSPRSPVYREGVLVESTRVHGERPHNDRDKEECYDKSFNDIRSINTDMHYDEPRIHSQYANSGLVNSHNNHKFYNDALYDDSSYRYKVYGDPRIDGTRHDYTKHDNDDRFKGGAMESRSYPDSREVKKKIDSEEQFPNKSSNHKHVTQQSKSYHSGDASKKERRKKNMNDSENSLDNKQNKNENTVDNENVLSKKKDKKNTNTDETSSNLSKKQQKDGKGSKAKKPEKEKSSSGHYIIKDQTQLVNVERRPKILKLKLPRGCEAPTQPTNKSSFDGLDRGASEKKSSDKDGDDADGIIDCICDTVISPGEAGYDDNFSKGNNSIGKGFADDDMYGRSIRATNDDYCCNDEYDSYCTTGKARDTGNGYYDSDIYGRENNVGAMGGVDGTGGRYASSDRGGRSNKYAAGVCGANYCDASFGAGCSSVDYYESSKNFHSTCIGYDELLSDEHDKGTQQTRYHQDTIVNKTYREPTITTTTPACQGPPVARKESFQKQTVNRNIYEDQSITKESYKEPSFTKSKYPEPRCNFKETCQKPTVIRDRYDEQSVTKSKYPEPRCSFKETCQKSTVIREPYQEQPAVIKRHHQEPTLHKKCCQESAVDRKCNRGLPTDSQRYYQRSITSNTTDVNATRSDLEKNQRYFTTDGKPSGSDLDKDRRYFTTDGKPSRSDLEKDRRYFTNDGKPSRSDLEKDRRYFTTDGAPSRNYLEKDRSFFYDRKSGNDANSIKISFEDADRGSLEIANTDCYDEVSGTACICPKIYCANAKNMCPGINYRYDEKPERHRDSCNGRNNHYKEDHRKPPRS